MHRRPFPVKCNSRWFYKYLYLGVVKPPPSSGITFRTTLSLREVCVSASIQGIHGSLSLSLNVSNLVILKMVLRNVCVGYVVPSGMLKALSKTSTIILWINKLQAYGNPIDTLIPIFLKQPTPHLLSNPIFLRCLNSFTNACIPLFAPYVEGFVTG